MNSHIETFRYHEVNNCLTVLYQGGTIFDYMTVSKEQYEDILKADNKNKAVRDLLRSGSIVGKLRSN